MGVLDAEGFATATGRAGIGILDLKPGTHQPVVEVQYDSVQVEAALGIDKDADPVRFDHLVHFSGSFLEFELVLESGATPSLYGHPEAVCRVPFLLEQGSDLVGGAVGDSYHRFQVGDQAVSQLR